ncbi:hypothetical protein AGRO_2266 [Agrobacterium sp. ATCC 31749]|nr:hypothetical protein AGRO_2266 [Agrobacterium sp. ATCC 31749]
MSETQRRRHMHISGSGSMDQKSKTDDRMLTE